MNSIGDYPSRDYLGDGLFGNDGGQGSFRVDSG